MKLFGGRIPNLDVVDIEPGAGSGWRGRLEVFEEDLGRVRLGVGAYSVRMSCEDRIRLELCGKILECGTIALDGKLEDPPVWFASCKAIET